MNFQKLYYFIDVVQLESITAAAKKEWDYPVCYESTD